LLSGKRAVLRGKAGENSMAPPRYWKGYLKLSLVTCAVSLTPATSPSEKIRFHTINSETGNRVRSRYVDAETGKVVSDKDQAKGYEIEEGRQIILEEDEIEAAAVESTRTINIEQFVPTDSIDWIWYDSPYYLLPEDDVAEEAFAVIREAMKATDTVGISRLVLARRERAVMLVPRDKGIVLWTLRYGDEVREADEIYGKAPQKSGEKEMVSLIQTLIKDKTVKWEPSLAQDPVQDKLKDIIAAKEKDQKKKPAKKKKDEDDEIETPNNVVSIMDALKRSIDKEKKGKR